MLRRALALLLPAALAASVLVGCGKTKGVLNPNLPPETQVFVSGPVDTVNHRVHLYWFGSDVDGDVVAFDLRMFNPNTPADTQWVRMRVAPGKGYDSLMTVYTPSGFAAITFQVRAIDDDGAPDPTPATQPFQFSNLPPIVRLLSPPGTSDTTFASVTVEWTADDPDGDGTKMRFLVWLDGNEATPDTVTERRFTVPSDRFLQGGTYLSGFRTLFVKGIDDGGLIGEADSTRWRVLAPASVMTNHKGKLLVIDDSWSTSSSNFTVDTLYANALARNPALTGAYRIIRLQYSNPFRSIRDLAQTLRQFEAVVWYRGFDAVQSVTMMDGADSLAAWAQAGGKLYLEGPYLFYGQNSFGNLSEQWAKDNLRVLRLHHVFDAVLGDSTVGLGNVTTSTLRSSMFPGSPSRLLTIPVTNSTPGLRGFVVDDTTGVGMWLMPGSLTSPTNTVDIPTVMAVRTAGNGRIIAVPFPVRNMSPAAGFDASFKVLARLLFDPTNGLLAP